MSADQRTAWMRAIAAGFLQRCQVLALQVFDHLHFQRLFVAQLLDARRDLRAAGSDRGAKTPLTGNDLVLDPDAGRSGAAGASR